MDTAEPLARALIGMLHKSAPPEDFTLRLSEAEALPGDAPDRDSRVEAVRMAMAVRNRLELLQQREQGMQAVMESAQDLSGRLDLPNLLAALVSRTRNLLGADMAWISELDESRGVFQSLAIEGALTQGSLGMCIRSDRGTASVVMATRTPFTTPDYLHDTRFQHEPEFDDIFRAEGICAVVGVPLIWQDKVIGLLFAANRYHRVHTAHSLAILRTLATHCAVALKNARDFDRLHTALGRADAARAELERHVRGVQTAADAHARITALLARGASLASLCQTVASLLGGCLLVLDEAAQVISRGAAEGHAGSAADGYAPHGPHSADLSNALRLARQTGRSVEAYEVDGETCRVVPVIGGDDVLGALALFHRGKLEEVAERTFERSSSVIGIVLLSQERQQASKGRDMASLLRALVSPRQDEAATLVNRAERFGLDLMQPLTLVLAEIDKPGASYAARRLLQLGSLERCLVDEIDGNLVVLCNATRSLELRQSLGAWGRREAGDAHRGVLSRPTASLAELPALYTTLRRALGVLGRLGVQGRLVGQNELALYSTLFETHDPHSLGEFLQACIGPLLEHDRKRGTDLASTLLCYFESSQNAKTAAQRLDIHVNTVRYRLATAEELLGHWGQAARALELHMALRLWSLRG
ncbi:helix-turn-helix domain-containing protein [Aquabacterium sp. OR-4]|uniref:helix-turn-helix domain-containing protein n=1 Tax=Aquabacterium sp. OR-4 TaxID=2978127 RepID=UPI0021B2F3EF|nr:GAF domain-containing protein [Aquabacterium sp. OR-4]MDT7835078.1 GAF domain-containing protein [Aquabacterium sp. OR-4]